MCTYLTERLEVTASAKSGGGWLRMQEASVYFDHPVDLPAEHSLNIDLLAPAAGPSARVGMELDAASALDLARAIFSMLAAAPPGLVDPEVAAAARQHLGAPAACGEAAAALR